MFSLPSSATKTPRTATKVVAASDSVSSDGADYVCDGTAEIARIKTATTAGFWVDNCYFYGFNTATGYGVIMEGSNGRINNSIFDTNYRGFRGSNAGPDTVLTNCSFSNIPNGGYGVMFDDNANVIGCVFNHGARTGLYLGGVEIK